MRFSIDLLCSIMLVIPPSSCSIDGDWVLIAVRCAPFVLVCLMDTHIFYQVCDLVCV